MGVSRPHDRIKGDVSARSGGWGSPLRVFYARIPIGDQFRTPEGNPSSLASQQNTHASDNTTDSFGETHLR